ncbi:MAG: hypothetical protein KJ887_01460 [Candidatus Omnitrophica bacterium]|nr:hypothetical protein [Candidatus Omnitrophota bacterium]MBU1047326.1 hypothetical protein [Candidatus Omnitrophota bacterium]MBU1630653.1 hypothetical protein [Candidatus Omnitrophota bacterium]MBU1767764.1 hypothetical protein [Candidatus Omnitrophota bacterium]MBU1889089.1 hypothetical protein [Candidatus Omnitrophota bacterium]
MATTQEIIERIDIVIKGNKKTEWIYIILSIILFLLGITCFIVALITREFAWSTPSVITTLLIYPSLKEILKIRQKNIALATAPILITQLPPDKAAEEIQKLLQTLHGEKNNAIFR